MKCQKWVSTFWTTCSLIFTLFILHMMSKYFPVMKIDAVYAFLSKFTKLSKVPLDVNFQHTPNFQYLTFMSNLHCFFIFFIFHVFETLKDVGAYHLVLKTTLILQLFCFILFYCYLFIVIYLFIYLGPFQGKWNFCWFQGKNQLLYWTT